VLEGIKAGGMSVDLSTNRPTLIRQIEPVFRQRGVSVVDAPVSGGKTGAATWHLAVMVGGERALYERLKLILAGIVNLTGGR
jgi:3-hydroxyisobutyrate dehydrogenase-like beta-hydroxyacid dehydrogenase